MGEDYIYAVTRIHIHEKGLLNKADMDALMAAKSLAEALNLLAAKGWDTQLVSGGDAEALVNREYEKTWALIAESAGRIEELNIFRQSRDFHNLKAAIKLAYAGGLSRDHSIYFLEYGLAPIDKIIQAAEARDFATLPGHLAKAGKAAWEILADTGNGQLCEITIDRASLESLWAEGQSAKSPLLREYAAFTVDAANIKSVMRCRLLGRNREFAEKAVAGGGSLDRKALIDAAVGDVGIGAYLANTPYAGAASGSFERWRNDGLMRMIKPERNAIYGVGPLAAYILARESEISMVRLILSSKAGGAGEGAVKERLGLTYV